MKVTCCRKLPCAVVAGLVFSLPVSLPAMAQTQIFKCESHGHVAYQDFPDQYAFLSQVVYKDLEEGKDATRTSLFIVKEVYSDPSGFYGAIFQDTVTNELVVAFRGTELPDDTVRDAIETDGQMFVDGVNQQLDGARRLMEKAIELSATGGIEGGAPNPVQLSVTGHSLGGSLAQVMSYDYNLYGETFNAYGATGVGDVPRGATVPEGQNTIVNHIRATDIVGLANTQYGEVREYATTDDARFRQAAVVATGHSLVGNDTLVDCDISKSCERNDVEWQEVA